MKTEFIFNGLSGTRLDVGTASQLGTRKEWSSATRSQVGNWIERGCVLINGKQAKKAGEKLRSGDHILIDAPEWGETLYTAFDFPLEILFEDEEVLVLNKPAGLSMHPGAGNKSSTLVNALIGYFERGGGKVPEAFKAAEKVSLKGGASLFRPGIVHRLDKDTTGVVVVAKTLHAHKSLSHQFAKRSVRRAYRALAFCKAGGRSTLAVKDSGIIDLSIGRHSSDRKKFAVVGEGGKTAVSRWRILERMNWAVLLEVRLETGRTHQIRVHMTHEGAPLIGDKTYGNFSALPAPLKKAHEEFARQALHAFLLEFEHPVTGKTLSFNAADPEDLGALIDVFRKF